MALPSEEGRAPTAIRTEYNKRQQAAISNGKNIDDQPPAQGSWGDRRGRLHRVEALLRRAYDDLAHEEDNPAARGLRNRATAQLDDASHLNAAAIGDQAF